MKFDTIYLDFASPLHIGNHKPEGYEKSEVFLRSDTLLAAVMQTWALIGKEEWIDEYIGKPNFTISSAFPFASVQNNVLHFFPRPNLEWNLKTYDSRLSKLIKKVQWLDQDYFEKVIHYHSFDLSFNQTDLQGAYLASKKIGPTLQKELQDRVAVPRERQTEANPFTMERLRFNEGAGLYFLVKGKIDRLKTALEILQYEGIGTDRNVGNGQFHFTLGAININVPSDTNQSTNLGLYCPSSDELNTHPPISFGLLNRGGWVTSSSGTGLRKFSINMFQEGSVFNGEATILGRHDIDLKPSPLNHPVYRSGRSLFIPVKSSES